jgi:hypothetical protein
MSIFDDLSCEDYYDQERWGRLTMEELAAEDFAFDLSGQLPKPATRTLVSNTRELASLADTFDYARTTMTADAYRAQQLINSL